MSFALVQILHDTRGKGSKASFAERVMVSFILGIQFGSVIPFWQSSAGSFSISYNTRGPLSPEGFPVYGREVRRRGRRKAGGRKGKSLKGQQCLWKAKPRHVVGVEEMWNYKKNPSHGCLKMMLLAALGITVVQAEKHLISSLALSLGCGCLGNLHAQYSSQIIDWALFAAYYTAKPKPDA